MADIIYSTESDEHLINIGEKIDVAEQIALEDALSDYLDQEWDY